MSTRAAAAEALRPLSPPVARLREVSLRYGKTQALDAVSLELPAGCMVGVIGPDGVGKSTLFSLVAGVRAIQSGKIEVLGGDMADARHRSEVVPRIAYMPQGLGKNLYPTLSVFENVEFFGRLFGQGRHERERRIADLLQATGLAPFPDRPAGLGAIIGSATGDAGAGAGIGAGIGLLGGALLGDQLQARQRQEQNLQWQLEAQQAEIERQRRELEQLKRQQAR